MHLHKSTNFLLRLSVKCDVLEAFRVENPQGLVFVIYPDGRCELGPEFTADAASKAVVLAMSNHIRDGFAQTIRCMKPGMILRLLTEGVIDSIRSHFKDPSPPSTAGKS